MNTPIRLALTMGDPAGIGPEIIIKAAHQIRDRVASGRLELKVLGSAMALAQAARILQLDSTAALHVTDVGPVEPPVRTGEVSASGGHWSYRAVERAVQLRVNGSERFAGHIVASGRRRGFLIETVKPAPPQGRSKESDGAASGLSPPA